MKHLFGLIILFLIAGNSFGQMTEAKHSIGSRVYSMDYRLASGSLAKKGEYSFAFETAYMRKFKKSLYFNIPIRVGVIDYNDINTNAPFVSGDFKAHYVLNVMSQKLFPYIEGGLGGLYTFDEERNDFNIPIGAGLHYKLAKDVFLDLGVEFRSSLLAKKSGIYYGIGVLYNLTKKEKKEPMPILPLDTDGDGVTDDIDNCPDIAGLAKFGGCPDTDGDGVMDKEDDCPEVAGRIETKGCPDKDKDGIKDDLDLCPDIAGLMAFNGCPDTDNDGIMDKDDDCPLLKGDKAHNGCPIADADGDGVEDAQDHCPNIKGPVELNGCPDTDGDGLLDKEDRCPTSSGPKSNGGCPVISVEDKEILDFAVQAVQFETGLAEFKIESYAILNQIADIMESYPDYKLTIYGHTDDVGHKKDNLELSQRRARACMDYLISRGISKSRMSSFGYGELQPITTNKTKEGRSMNRRVEFDLHLD